MDFRRSGQLDERRRRVLMDEIASPADADHPDAPSAASGSAKGPVRAYHAAVLSERQPKVTDLLPVRPLGVIVALLLGLTGIAAIEVIHVHAVTLSLADGGTHLAALDATQRGSLAAWYASAMLAAAAALSIVVFSIRSHRVDDYRGHYRIWLWSAAILVWLSLDAATGIHDALGLALTLVTGNKVVTTSLVAGCTLTWIAVYGLILGTLGLRLVFEIWSSRLSLTALVTSGFLYLNAALLELEMLKSPATLIAGVAESTIVLLAHFSLLASVAFYARHVLLDATGRLKVHIDPDRKGKAKRAKLKVVKSEKQEETNKPAAPSSKPSEPVRFGSAPAANSPVAKPGAAIAKNSISAPEEEYDEDEDDDYGGSNLSKSERRRLKKLARREQQRRAA